MVYATEETPLGTAGSVLNAREELDERFLVISGDVLTDIDLSAVVDFHEKKGALATLALCSVENPLEFGIVITAEDGSIERFLEKPTWGQVFSDTINTGIYVLEPEIFDFIPAGRAVDFSGEVFPEVLAAGRPIFGYVAEGYWEDVGTTEAYLKAHQDILDGKVEVEMAGFPLRPGVWLGKGSTVDPTALGGRARPSSATTARSAPAPCSASTPPSAPTSASPRAPRSAARWWPTTGTSGPGCGWRGRSSAARATCARAPAASRGRCSARGAWSGRTPRCGPG